MKILVVDDEELIREVIKEYLIIEDYVVDEAADGEEAVKLAKDKDYDLIIMEIMTPNKDGYQACKEIKQLKRDFLNKKANIYLKINKSKLGTGKGIISYEL